MAKERRNLAKHGLDFSFADLIFSDSLAVSVFDRHENGEDRWHAFALVGTTLLMAVYAYPDPDDETWVRVISLRKATPRERALYDQGDFD